MGTFLMGKGAEDLRVRQKGRTSFMGHTLELKVDIDEYLNQVLSRLKFSLKDGKGQMRLERKCKNITSKILRSRENIQ